MSSDSNLGSESSWLRISFGLRHLGELPMRTKLKADGTNYFHWRAQIRTDLKSTHLESYILPPTQPIPTLTSATTTAPDGTVTIISPSEEEIKAYGRWEQADATVKLYIMSSVSSDHFLELKETARELWQSIVRRHEYNNALMACLRMRDIFTFAITDTKPLGPQFDQLRDWFWQLGEAGHPLDDQIFANYVVMNLPEPYHVIRINYSIKESINLNHAIAAVLAQEALHKKDRELEAEARAQVQRNRNRGNKWCTNCAKRGHLTRECWAQGGGQQGKRSG